MIGAGAVAKIYEVDEHIVLKASHIHEFLGTDAPALDRWSYVDNALYSSCSMKDERIVLRLLRQRLHPNIIEALDTEYEEGLYLRRYLSLSDRKVRMQEDRIRWYQDITSGLVHLHYLRIAHSDLRVDNILFDQQGKAMLCDFSGASSFGHPNVVHPNLLFTTNGPSEILSDATDRVSMGSLIFDLEHGTRPQLSVAEDGTLTLPKIQCDHQGINAAIRKASEDPGAIKTTKLTAECLGL